MSSNLLLRTAFALTLSVGAITAAAAAVPSDVPPKSPCQTDPKAAACVSSTQNSKAQAPAVQPGSGQHTTSPTGMMTDPGSHTLPQGNNGQPLPSNGQPTSGNR